MNIIGIGPGNENMLTLAARDALSSSEVVFAAPRHARLTPESAKVLPLEPLYPALDVMEEWVSKDRAVSVLLSGDTGIFSMLPLISQRLGAENLVVFPGISALQVLSAAEADVWHDARILSGHGRTLTEPALAYAIRSNSKVILFCDKTRDASWIANALVNQGLPHVEMVVGEKLSYPDQRVFRGTAMELSSVRADPLCVVMLKNPRPEKGFPPMGIDDERFARGKTPMTKREVRVQIIAALGLDPDSVLWDIGAGTGSVSVECARQCPLGEVYAVERDADACALIANNAASLGAGNVHLIEGHAPECLANLPVPTHVFIGGSGGSMEGIFTAIEAQSAPVRVVASAVTMEGEQAILKGMSEYRDFQMAQIAVSRIEKVGSYHMRRAQNPVAIASGTWEGKI